MAESGRQFDLTQSQLLIWTGQNLQPHDPLYNMVLKFTIEGPLDPDIFRSAFEKLVEHCDTLRCTFGSVDGIPKQRFSETPISSLQYVDFSVDQDPELRLEHWIEQHKLINFDLGTCPYESALLKLGEHRYVWYLNQHHLITDAWAVSVIFENMQRYYRLGAEGRLADAEKLPTYEQYLAYEARQRESTLQEKARAYWTGRLETPLRPSRFYRKVPAKRSGRTVRGACRLGPERSAAIRALATRAGFESFSRDLSLFQIFCTVLTAYLHRVTGNPRIAIGTPSHNRVSARLKQTVGLLIEIFPVVTEIDDGETFTSLYRKVADATREMLMNAPPGSSNSQHNRAYDVLLNYITASFGDFDGIPTRTEWIHADHGDRNHLLRLQVHDFDRSGGIDLHFDLNAGAFLEQEREWVSSHYLCLLDAMLADPEQPLAEIALRPTGRDSPPTSAIGPGCTGSADERHSVLDLFERRARAEPDSIAVVCAEERVTFGELDRRASALAARIAERAGTDGARVAVAMRRSADCVATILGILKSGNTYVPVDVDYPEERVRFILEDSRASLLITDTWAASRLPTMEIDSLCPGHADKGAPEGEPSCLPIGRRADVPAYIIYTSGSTGHPKGVVVGHTGLSAYIRWASRFYDRGRRLHFALFSSLSFDLTVTSLFTPLVSGGCLIVYPESDDPGDLTIRRVIQDDAADIIKLTPSHLALLQSLDLSGSRLRTLIVGGEDLKTDLARAIVNKLDQSIELYNEYGPTEGTVACMIHRFDPDRDKEVSVPIGRPIDHARIYLLDDGGNPVPRGITGQIFIGGPGVAEGYFGQPSLTAERFIDEPEHPGHRMYATGDLGRWSASGDMEFLGRRDEQIKIRGYRIEPAEIETALCDITQITDCVVVARDRAQTSAAGVDQSYCVRCGLSATHPSALLDEHGLCRVCRAYEGNMDRARAYFRTMDDLRALAARMKAESNGDHDCLMLLSGGKDSTYALCRLVDLGLKPLVFTLDNGFISDGAKANIRRIVDQLGLELVVGETPSMNEIFVDSLNRFSNVCDGCFKTIYTLSMNLAEQRGIRYICTGLSRGQIFETRVADLFHQDVFDPAKIDRTIMEARKTYHRLQDAVSKRLDVRIFSDDEVFERIQYVDFYRYCDVTLDEMLDYLATRAPWVRPADTGRSTNCLINEVGIYVHKKQRGYHNYSLPYSWDVRLGHKDRDAAREELDDDIDVANVRRILNEIGYTADDDIFDATASRSLIAYYVAPAEIPVDELRDHLARRLPAEFVPREFVRLEALPLSPNGKIDRDSLPEPAHARPELRTGFVQPLGHVEKTLARIWSDILDVEPIGATDNFFDLGGESILNIQIVAAARKLGIDITPQQIFDHPTIRELAAVAGDVAMIDARQGTITGPVRLTPIQKRFFQRQLPDPDHFSQSVLLELADPIDPGRLESALTRLLFQHDALRSRFEQIDGVWRQHLCDAGHYRVRVENLTDPRFAADPARSAAASELAARLSATLSVSNGELVRAALIDAAPGSGNFLIIVIHHLVIDGVSWWILLEDLQTALDETEDPVTVALPEKTTSVRQWSEMLSEYAASPQAEKAAGYWTDNARQSVRLPGERDPGLRSDARTLSEYLNRTETSQLLHQVPGAYRTQVPDVLLAAIAPALAEWSGSENVQIDIEGHGRESVVPGADLLRTVGWFTSLYPVILDTRLSDADTGALLKSIKEQLRAIPNRGVDFGIVRYLGDSALAEQLERWRESQVLFNYLGQWDRRSSVSERFRLAAPISVSMSPDAARDHLIEINALVFDGKLRIDWTYNDSAHDSRAIARVAARSMTALRELIDHCLRVGDGEFTPSDFPTADLSQSELDSLIAEFGE